jgi:SNARE protein 1
MLKGLLEAEKLNDASERLVAAQILSPRAGIASDTSGNKQKDRSRDIFVKTRAKFTNEVREELMPRKRTAHPTDTDDTDLVLKYHHDMQEKVAAEMVSMAHNLKENLTIANEIIRKDVEVLEGTSSHADTSLSGLKQNTDKLSDFTARACQYWLWICLALVSLCFLYMVVFIRMFPKRASY